MKIKEIQESLEAEILAGKDKLYVEVEHIYASDLMSDVLAFGKPKSLLLTGLATQQAVISAHMAEFDGVVLIRGKKTKDGSERFAEERQMVLLSTQLDMYESCLRIGLIDNKYTSQIAGGLSIHKKEEVLLSQEFFIEGNDFANAGLASTKVKSILKKIGFNPVLIRRVAIATYEGEMNVVMHASKGTVKLGVTSKLIEVVIEDKGKGIPDVDLAMQEGFTTATEEMRAMGFGSGMGLPNIKRNSDELKVESEVEKGTKLSMKFFIN